MIKRTHLMSGAALAAAALLGSCGGGGGAVVAMEQGQWEMTMRVANVRMDNLPEGMRTEMSQMRNNETHTSRSCLSVSADVVRIQNLRFTIPMPLRRAGPAPGCHIAELSMEGGRIRGQMSCEGIPTSGPMNSGPTMTLSGEMSGSYTARTLDLTTSGEVRSGAQNGSAEFRITGRRVGACPPPPVYTPPPPPSVMVPQPMPNYAPPPPVVVPRVVPTPYRPPSGNKAGNAM